MTSVAMETTLVQTSNSSSMGDSYLVDVTIRHPGCKTNIMHGSARQQLAAAHKGEAEKKAKYAAMAKTQQAAFLPFAVETYGGLGKQLGS